MRIAVLITCLALCSCSRDDSPAGGDAAKWISIDETRRVGMHILLNRYPQAEIVSEQGAGATRTYRFATNGVTVPMIVVVDRNTAKARFEKATP